ncbi:glycosyltransferase [Acidiferrimicrobium sp. IK]|uniref:glycosyltransferase n=1 Tax=Acidiferrimicrobium sp. IK TaxID=2871700 RepID=UPI0021CB05F1|nr:glycosyltransferase [Acidiferrimicrobium sp. IK]
MPAHNEASYLEEALRRAVTGLRERGDAFEVLVVENGSTDDTAAVAARMAAAMEEVSVLSLPHADYGRALRAGFVAASGRQVINFDVDLVNLEFVDAARKAAEQEAAAIVVGSKRGPGADDGRPVARRIVTAVFSTLLKVAFGLKVSDTHGLKLLEREALLPHVRTCLFGGDIFDTEVVLRAERAGLTVTEVPVTVSDGRPPRTSIARRIPRTLMGLLRLRVALWRSGLHPPAIR